MKLRTLIPVAAIALLASCGPTTYEATTDETVVIVPDHTRTAFTTQYPTATMVVWNEYEKAPSPVVDWELTGWPVLDDGDYVVAFNMNNEPYYAWYDSDGTWIGTAYVVSDFKTLPASISTVVTQQYPTYTISSVTKEFWKDKTAYEVELKSGNTKVKLLVDENGNILKQKTKTM